MKLSTLRSFSIDLNFGEILPGDVFFSSRFYFFSSGDVSFFPSDVSFIEKYHF
jgi:hypothetical protein